mmetsp:Transcript_996/g.2962  ORF Transcript_996/g.2962 Transcript_996/m.2962 type:complete len:331 (+) Transcript_996:37-1029(+)
MQTINPSSAQYRGAVCTARAGRFLFCCGLARAKGAGSTAVIRLVRLGGPLLLRCGGLLCELVARLEEGWHPAQLEGEEVDHREVVAELQPAELAREVDLHRREEEEHAEGVQEARVELGDLPRGHPVLERVVDAEARHKVVRVHDDVRDAVDEGAVLRRAVAVAEGEEEAPHHPDRGVVVEVQERHLHRRLLLQDHPQRVAPVHELGEEVDEDEPLAGGRVLGPDPEHVREVGEGGRPHADRHVRAQHHLRNVVQLHRRLHPRRRRRVAHQEVAADGCNEVARWQAVEHKGREQKVVVRVVLHTRVEVEGILSRSVAEHGATKAIEQLRQ